MISEEFNIVSVGGVNLYAASFLPDNHPKALICLVHGLGDHIGRYAHVIDKFVGSGIGVYGLDLRGHGKSEGQRGHGTVPKILEDIQELVIVTRRDFNDVPIFLYGHSMGGNLAANYLIRLISSEIKGAIISSPWFRLNFKEPKLKYAMGQVIHNLFPSFSFSNGLNPDDFAHDKIVGKVYSSDPLVHDRISARLFFSIKKYGEFAVEKASLIEIPILVTHGSDDPITSKVASREFADQLSKVEYKIWEKTKHEPHNDFTKEDIIQYYISWVNKNI